MADAGRCGSCKTALPPASAPLDVDRATFDEIVSQARVPVLVDFWAAWCGPCRIAAPEVKKVAAETAGRALVLKVNTEENPDLAARFQVSAIPYFMVLSGGKPVVQQAGLVDSRQMRSLLDQAKGAQN